MTVPTKEVRDDRGVVVAMRPGPCLWCGQWVESGREMAGATNPYDPCWQADGDFGCDASPETNEEGCGDHARPYDLAVRLLGLVGDENNDLRNAIAWRDYVLHHDDRDKRPYRDLPEEEKELWRQRVDAHVATLIKNEAFRGQREKGNG